MRGNLARRHQPQVANGTSNASALEISGWIVDACGDAKGKEPTVLATHEVSDIFTNIVIVSGTSDRQVQGITNKVLDQLRKRGISPLAVEGMDQAHWVIVDYGEVVLHVFYEPMRARYDLESLWARAPRVKLGV